MRTTEAALRRVIREELTRIHEAELTVGDVKAALKYAKGKRAKDAAAEFAKEAGKKAAAVGVKSFLSIVPGLAGLADAVEAGLELKDLYDAASSATPEQKKANPLWDRLTVDPDTSRIIDDEVEDRFATELGNRISDLPDDAVLPDADTQLRDWLKDRYSGAHVTKGS